MTTGKTKPGAQTPDALLDALDHPMRAEIDALRAIILKAHPGLVEGVKWNAPSYSVDGEDRITFQLRAKDKILLVFHRGAKKKAPPKRGRLIEDESGLLEWADDDRAIATFRAGEVATKKKALATVVKRWLAAADTA